MSERNSKTEAAPPERPGAGATLIGWMLLPFALFPLVALITYDWRAIEALSAPPAPSSNWMGVLGDSFAYYGYQLFGLGVWTVPVACAIWGICLVAGRRMRPGRREVWFAVMLASVSCLMQTAQGHAAGISALLRSMNLANAGGAVGYLVMTRGLSPLLSDFGSSAVMLMVLFFSIIAAIGLHNLIAFFKAVYRWAMVRPREETAAPEGDAAAAAQMSAREAREAARREREEERERIRAEKLAEKEAKRAAKEAERAQLEAARQAAIADREADLARRREEALRRAQPQQLPLQPPAPQTDKASAPALTPRPTAATVAAANPAQQSPEPEPKPEQPKPDKGPYVLPGIDLLNPLVKSEIADEGDVEETSRRLIDTLKLFGIEATLSYSVRGPVVTKYAVELAPGTRYSVVTSISDNLMGALHAKSLRIEAPIPGEDRVGIEVPNRKPAGISFREIFESKAWRSSKAELPLLFGKDAAGNELVADLATMPHMLVAGATGQGKSVCLNSLINGLLMTRTPDELKLIMVDPKSVEFTPYAAIPHLLVPVITDNRKVIFALNWAVAEMEKRLKLFARNRVRNIYDYNHRKRETQQDLFGEGDAGKGGDPATVPYIVIIIDEVADLMSTSAKEVTPNISRLTAKARAAGIHLILATQRPDAKVITGTIKANIPGRVAFKTAQAIDSRTILDDAGAENLIGRGDMLFKSKDGRLIRAQGAWISDEEIARITEFIEQHADTQFDEKFALKLGRVKEAEIEDPFASNEDDPDNQAQTDSSAGSSAAETRAVVKAAEASDLYKRAVEVIINTNRASVSHFQRKLGIGYNHAAKICDRLEAEGVIAPQSGAGPRTILLDQNQLVAILNGGEIQTAQEMPPEDATADDAARQTADAFGDTASEDNEQSNTLATEDNND